VARFQTTKKNTWWRDCGTIVARFQKQRETGHDGTIVTRLWHDLKKKEKLSMVARLWHDCGTISKK